MKLTEDRRLRPAIPLIILWLAFGLRLFQIDTQSIWWDEGHSIFVATHPLVAIPTLPAMDVHPPAYFALLHLWMFIAGATEFSLRYFSTIFGLLLVALVWRFGRDLADGHLVALLAALFTTLSPLYIAYSQEVRSYTMITFLAAGSCYFLWRIALRKPLRRTDIAAYILLTAASLYTHYFTVFLLLFQNVVWIIWVLRPGSTIHTQASSYNSVTKRIIIWVVSQGFVLLLFLPQAAVAIRQVTAYTNPNLIPPAIAEFAGRTWQAFTVGLTIDPSPAQWTVWLITGVLFGSWLLVLSLSKPFRHSPFAVASFLFLLVWLFIPLAAYYIVLQSRPSFEPRYLMLATPPISLLLAMGLGQLSSMASQLPLTRARYAAGGLVVFFAGAIFAGLFTGLYHYYTNESFFKDDSAGVAHWLSAHTTASDIIYVDVPHPFHYYAKRLNIEAPTRYLFVDINTAADVLNREAAGNDRLYWVTWRGSDTDPRGVVPFLAEKAGTLAGQQDFLGYRVTWFDLPGDASFSLPTRLQPANAVFGDVLRLDGVEFGRTATQAEPVWATLHFTMLRDTDINYKVSLRLRSDDGPVIAQVDRDLLNDRHFRTAAWPLSDSALNQATNVYLLPLPPDVRAGTYQLEAVVYSAEPPYPAEGVTGEIATDGAAALLGTVTVP